MPYSGQWSDWIYVLEEQRQWPRRSSRDMGFWGLPKVFKQNHPNQETSAVLSGVSTGYSLHLSQMAAKLSQIAIRCLLLQIPVDPKSSSRPWRLNGYFQHQIHSPKELVDLLRANIIGEVSTYPSQHLLGLTSRRRSQFQRHSEHQILCQPKCSVTTSLLRRSTLLNQGVDPNASKAIWKPMVHTIHRWTIDLSWATRSEIVERWFEWPATSKQPEVGVVNAMIHASDTQNAYPSTTLTDTWFVAVDLPMHCSATWRYHTRSF